MGATMSSRAVLVGAIGLDRFYYLLDTSERSQPDGAIVGQDGQARLVNFSQTAATSRNLKRFSTSEFHEFLWGTHTGDDLVSWRNTFINKTQPVPNALLANVPIKEDLLPAEKKKKKVAKKVQDFKKRQQTKSILASSLTSEIDVKTLGRTIRRGAFSSVAFDPNAFDADGDGFVQDSTPYMRPALPSNNVGMRSAAMAEKAKLSLSERARKTLTPINIESIRMRLTEAIEKGFTYKSRNTKLEDYLDVDEMSFIRIIDTNPATGKTSKVEFASWDLMEIEKEVHALGLEIVERAMESIDFESSVQQRHDDLLDLERDSVTFDKNLREVASQFGFSTKIFPNGDVDVDVQFTEDLPPRNPTLSLRKAHKETVQSVASLRKRLQQIEDAAENDWQLEVANIRKEIEQEIDKYIASVNSAIDEAIKKRSGYTRSEWSKALNERISGLFTSTDRQRLALRIFDSLRELGISFGESQLKTQAITPKLDPTVRTVIEGLDSLTATFIPDAIIDDINDGLLKKLKFKRTENPEDAGSWDVENSTIETNGDDSTTLHDIIHMATSYNPTLHALQQLILMARTVGIKGVDSRSESVDKRLKAGWEELTPIGQDNYLKDEFEDFYAGRIYGSGARETLTRAIDYLLDKNFSGSSYFDKDLIASLIGSLVVAAYKI